MEYEMNYQKIYDNIVLKAKTRDLKKDSSTILETHHILPRSCGGGDCLKNLVNLTLREHYICHLLLERIYRNTNYHAKMLRAAFLMGRNSNKNSRAYQIVKEAHIQNLKKQTISEEQKQAISLANKGNKARLGMKNSPKHIEAMRNASLGRIPSEETRKLWSEQRKGRIPWNKGMTGGTLNYPKTRKSRGKHSAQTIEKMRLARINWHKNKKDTMNEIL